MNVAHNIIIIIIEIATCYEGIKMFDLLTRVREYPMNEMSSSKSEKKSKIDLKKLEIYFDSDFRLVKEHEFRRAVFQGISKFLFQIMLKTFNFKQ